MDVVLVDNDAAFLRSAELMLRADGHRVHTFVDPERACDFIEHGGRLDVLLLDYLMPQLSGVQVLDRIQQHLPRDARVVLVSGHTDLVQSLDLKSLGIAAFLPKPLDLQKLDDLLARISHQVSSRNAG